MQTKKRRYLTLVLIVTAIVAYIATVALNLNTNNWIPNESLFIMGLATIMSIILLLYPHNCNCAEKPPTKKVGATKQTKSKKPPNIKIIGETKKTIKQTPNTNQSIKISDEDLKQLKTVSVNQT